MAQAVEALGWAQSIGVVSSFGRDRFAFARKMVISVDSSCFWRKSAGVPRWLLLCRLTCWRFLKTLGTCIMWVIFCTERASFTSSLAFVSAKTFSEAVITLSFVACDRLIALSTTVDSPRGGCSMTRRASYSSRRHLCYLTTIMLQYGVPPLIKPGSGKSL